MSNKTPLPPFDDAIMNHRIPPLDDGFFDKPIPRIDTDRDIGRVYRITGKKLKKVEVLKNGEN